MINREAMERMSPEELTSYVLRRVRLEEEDPPLARYHFETPDDFIAVVYGQSKDLEFRSRLEEAIVQALDREAESDDLSLAPDTAAIENLAPLALRQRIKKAGPALLRIAGRGAFGGHAGVLSEQVERSVLFALAGLQEPKVLWERWGDLWERAEPALWPIVTAGLRISNPYRATKLLPDMVRRALAPKGFPVGELLWVFAKDPQIDAEQVRAALKALGADQREACRRGLREVGASEEQIAEWIPRVQPSTSPGWARPDRQLQGAFPQMSRRRHDAGAPA